MTKRNYSVFVPIYNLELSDEIGGEIQIEDVLFISSKKIPRVRQRLGLYHPVSEYNKWFSSLKQKLFSDAKVYALIRTKREADEPLIREFSRIKQAVYILSSSKFYSERRDRIIFFGGPEFKHGILDNQVLFENSGKEVQWPSQSLGALQPYKLKTLGKSYREHHFFPNLLRILNGEIRVDKEWKDNLRRASLLAGQSQFARDFEQAFLFDMIALEVLLTKQGDKFPDSIIERVVAFLGWVKYADLDEWKIMIQRLYKLRCEYVHTAKVEDLTVRDLINADMILANLLYNLCRLTKIIKSKNDIIVLAQKLRARQILGMRMKDRPRPLRFRRQLYSPADLKKLEGRSHWSW